MQNCIIYSGKSPYQILVQMEYVTWTVSIRCVTVGLGGNFLPYWTLCEATSLGLVRRLIAVAVRSVVVIVLVCGISFLAFFTAFAQAPLGNVH